MSECFRKFKKIIPENNMNFDDYIKNIKNYEEISHNFLKLFNNITLNKRDLISIILIAKYSDIVASNENIDNHFNPFKEIQE